MLRWHFFTFQHWIETFILNIENEIKRWQKKNRILFPFDIKRGRSDEKSKKNRICMQQHYKNKADSNEKLETVASKQTPEGWKPVNFICENKIEWKVCWEKNLTGHDINKYGETCEWQREKSIAIAALASWNKLTLAHTYTHTCTFTANSKLFGNQKSRHCVWLLWNKFNRMNK